MLFYVGLSDRNGQKTVSLQSYSKHCFWKHNLNSSHFCNMQIFQHTTRYVLYSLLAHTLWFFVVLTRFHF